MHPVVRWVLGWRSNGAWLWLSALVIVLDQLTKRYIVQHFEYAQVMVVNDYFNITRLHNTGAAFSFLAGASGWQHWLFVGLGLAVSIGIVLWLRLLRGRGILSAALALMLGGALGNVIDRVQYGWVIDFIHVHYEQHFFPAFNVADSALTLGAILLIIDGFFSRSAEEAALRKAAKGGSGD
ncbi:MAG: signal peptidase II [Pseudomonadota bacterium]